jgi:hypothetical protein
MRVGPPFGAVGWRTATIVVHTVEGVAAVMEGRLPAGLPYLRLGQGPPLVMALGGVAEHANPVGAGRRVSLATAARFAEHFTVYVTSRKPGLAPGTTMADIAADYAAAIGEEFGGPVAFHGTSAGGASGCSWRSATRSWCCGWSWPQPPAACHHRAATCWPRSPAWPRRVTRAGHRLW